MLRTIWSSLSSDICHLVFRFTFCLGFFFLFLLWCHIQLIHLGDALWTRANKQVVRPAKEIQISRYSYCCTSTCAELIKHVTACLFIALINTPAGVIIGARDVSSHLHLFWAENFITGCHKKKNFMHLIDLQNKLPLPSRVLGCNSKMYWHHINQWSVRQPSDP